MFEVSKGNQASVKGPLFALPALEKAQEPEKLCLAIQDTPKWDNTE